MSAQGPGEAIREFDSRDAVAGVLPHGEPFLWVDKASVSPGKSVTGSWTPGATVLNIGSPFNMNTSVSDGDTPFTVASENEWPVFGGHFPENNQSPKYLVVPGVIALAALVGEENEHIASVRSVVWREPIQPEDNGIFRINSGSADEENKRTIEKGEVLLGEDNPRVVAMVAKGVVVRKSERSQAPLVPLPALIEHSAQVAAVGVLCVLPNNSARGIPVFRRAIDVVYHAPVIPGQELDTRITVRGMRQDVGVGKASAEVFRKEDEAMVLSVGAITFALVAPETDA